MTAARKNRNQNRSARSGPPVVGATAADVFYRWKLRGDERTTLAELARSCGLSRAAMKMDLACLATRLAWAEADETWDPLDRATYNRRLLQRGIYHARRILADAGPSPARFVELHPAHVPAVDPWQEPAEPSTAAARAVRELLACVTAPQERALFDAFLEEGCTTMADVERLYGWSPGHATTVARRLRRKANRRGAA